MHKRLHVITDIIGTRESYVRWHVSLYLRMEVLELVADVVLPERGQPGAERQLGAVHCCRTMAETITRRVSAYVPLAEAHFCAPLGCDANASRAQTAD